MRRLGLGRLVALAGVALAGVALVLLLPGIGLAGDKITLDLGAGGAASVGPAVKMLVVLTALTLAPAVLLSMTCFVRIAVVFAFLRTALGVQNVPPQQVLTGLALFLTVAVMTPIGTRVYHDGIEPYLDGKVGVVEAMQTGSKPLRSFMLRQTRETDIALFYDMARADTPATPDDVAMHLLIPAFVLSELNTAFQMGFMLFAPFLVLDLVVASILMAMGMVMLPPALISLPVKILLFVMVDGWNLLVGSLVRSFA